MIRPNFPGCSGGRSLQPVSWDSSVQQFEDRGPAGCLEDPEGVDRVRLDMLLSPQQRTTDEHRSAWVAAGDSADDDDDELDSDDEDEDEDEFDDEDELANDDEADQDDEDDEEDEDDDEDEYDEDDEEDEDEEDEDEDTNGGIGGR